MPQLLMALLYQKIERTIDGHSVTFNLFQRDTTGNWPIIEDDMHEYMVSQAPLNAQFAAVVEIYGPDANRAFSRFTGEGQSPDNLLTSIERDARSEIANAQEIN